MPDSTDSQLLPVVDTSLNTPSKLNSPTTIALTPAASEPPAFDELSVEKPAPPKGVNLKIPKDFTDDYLDEIKSPRAVQLKLPKPQTFETLEEERQHRKFRLTLAHRLFRKFSFDEGVSGFYTARDPVTWDHFWVCPFGQSFASVKPTDLLLVNEKGEVIEQGITSTSKLVDLTTFSIHSTIYKVRPDVASIALSQSGYGRIFSALGRILDPVNQESCAFYERHDLYAPEVILEDFEEPDFIADKLGLECHGVILQNRGLLTVGHSVEETFWWHLSMHSCCESQILAEAAASSMSMLVASGLGGLPVKPTCLSHEAATKTRNIIGSHSYGYFSSLPYFQDAEEEWGDKIRDQAPNINGKHINGTESRKEECNVQLKKSLALSEKNVEFEEIKDLELDLRDGMKLLTMFHVLSNDRTVPQPERSGRAGGEMMRIHKIINVDKALKWLQLKLPEQLSNISAEDIVDGNLKLIMGLIWRFRIGSIETEEIQEPAESDLNNGVSTKPKQKRNLVANNKNVKASLLYWCQRVLSPYTLSGILPPISDFSQIWQSGVAFLSLVHSYDNNLVPELTSCIPHTQADGTEIEPIHDLSSLPNLYRSTNVDVWMENLQRSFDLAETGVGIPTLLEPEDIAKVDIPDERVVMTYISEFYHLMRDRPLPPHPDEVAQKMKRKEQEELNNIKRQADSKFRDQFSLYTSSHLKESARLGVWINKQQQGFMKLSWVLTTATSLESAQEKLSILVNDTFISNLVKCLIGEDLTDSEQFKSTIKSELANAENQLKDAILILSSNELLVNDDVELLGEDLQTICKKLNKFRAKVHTSALELKSLDSSGELQFNIDTGTTDDTHLSSLSQLTSFASDTFASAVEQVNAFLTFTREWDSKINAIKKEIFGNDENGRILLEKQELDEVVKTLTDQVEKIAKQDSESATTPEIISARKLAQRTKVVRKALSPLVSLMNGNSTTILSNSSANFYAEDWEDNSELIEEIEEIAISINRIYTPRAANLRTRLSELIGFLESEQMAHLTAPLIEESGAGRSKSPSSHPLSRPTSMTPSTFSSIFAQRRGSVVMMPASTLVAASRFSFLPIAIVSKALDLALDARNQILNPVLGDTMMAFEKLQEFCDKTLKYGAEWRHIEKQSEIDLLKEIRISSGVYCHKVGEAVRFLSVVEEELGKSRRQDPSENKLDNNLWLKTKQQWCSQAKNNVASFLGLNASIAGENILVTKEGLNIAWNEIVVAVQKQLGDLSEISTVTIIQTEGSTLTQRENFDFALDFQNTKGSITSDLTPHKSTIQRAQTMLEALISFEQGPLAQAFENQREGIVVAWLSRTEAVEEELERVAMISGVSGEEMYSPVEVEIHVNETEADMEFVEEACRYFAQDIVAKWWGSAKDSVMLQTDDISCLELLAATLRRENEFRDTVRDSAHEVINDMKKEAARISDEIVGGFLVDIWGEFLKDTENVVSELAEEDDENADEGITALLERVASRAVELKLRVTNVNNSVANITRRMSKEVKGIQMVSERILAQVVEPSVLWLMRSQGVVEDIESCGPEINDSVKKLQNALEMVLSEIRSGIHEQEVKQQSGDIKTLLQDLQVGVEEIESRVKTGLRKRVQGLKRELPGSKKKGDFEVGEEVFDEDVENDPPHSATDEEDPLFETLALGGFLKARLTLFVKNLQMIGKLYGLNAKILQDNVRSVLDWSRAIAEFDKESRTVVQELRRKVVEVKSQIARLPNDLCLGIGETEDEDIAMDDKNFEILSSVERAVNLVEEMSMREGWTTYKFYRVQEVATGLVSLLHSAANDGGMVRAAVDSDVMSKIQDFISERMNIVESDVFDLEGESGIISWARQEIAKSKAIREKIGVPGNMLLRDVRGINQDIKVLETRLLGSFQPTGTSAVSDLSDIATVARELRIGRVKLVLDRAFSPAIDGKVFASLEEEPRIGVIQAMNDCVNSLRLDSMVIDFVDEVKTSVVELSSVVEKLEVRTVERALESWRKFHAETCERMMNDLEIQVSRSVKKDGESPTQYFEGLIEKYEKIKGEAESMWKSIVYFERATEIVVQVILEIPTHVSASHARSPPLSSANRKSFMRRSRLVSIKLNDELSESENENETESIKAEPLRKRYNDILNRYINIHETLGGGLQVSKNGKQLLSDIIAASADIDAIEKDIDLIASSAVNLLHKEKSENLSTDIEFDALERRMEAVEEQIMMKMGAQLDHILPNDDVPLSPSETPNAPSVDFTLIPANDRETIIEILPMQFQGLVDHVSRVRDTLSTTHQSRSVLELYKKQASEVRVWVETRVAALRAIEQEVSSEVARLLEKLGIKGDNDTSSFRDSRSSLGESVISQTVKNKVDRDNFVSAVAEASVRAAERSAALRNVENTLERYIKGNEKLRAFAVKVAENYMENSTKHRDSPNSEASISAAISQEQKEIDDLWDELTASLTRVRTRLEYRTTILDWAERSMDKTEAGMLEAVERIEGGEGWSAVLIKGLGKSQSSDEPGLEKGSEAEFSSMSKRSLALENFSKCADEVLRGWEDDVLMWEEETDQLGQAAFDIQHAAEQQKEEIPLMEALVEQNVVVLRDTLGTLQTLFEDRRQAFATLGHKLDVFVLKHATCKGLLEDTAKQLRERLFSEKKIPEFLDRKVIEIDSFVLTGNDKIDKPALMAWVRTQVATSMSVQNSYAQKMNEISSLAEEINNDCDEAFEGGTGAGVSVMVIVKELVEEADQQIRNVWKEASRLAAAEKDAVDRATKYHQVSFPIAINLIFFKNRFLIHILKKWNSMINRLSEEVSETLQLLLDADASDLGDEDLQQIRERMKSIESAVEKVGKAVDESQRASLIGGLMAASAESRNSSFFRGRHENLAGQLMQVMHRLKELEEMLIERKWHQTVDEQIDKVTSWCNEKTGDLKSRMGILPPADLLEIDLKPKSETSGKANEGDSNSSQNTLKAIVRLHTALNLEFSQKSTAIDSLVVGVPNEKGEVIKPEQNRLQPVQTLLANLSVLISSEKSRIEHTQRLFSHHRSAIDIVTWIDASRIQIEELSKKVELHQANLAEAIPFSNKSRQQKLQNPEAEVKEVEDRINTFDGTIKMFIELGNIAKEQLVTIVATPTFEDMSNHIGALESKTEVIVGLWDELKKKMSEVKGSSAHRTRQVEFQKITTEITKIIDEITDRYSGVQRNTEDRGRATPGDFGRATPGDRGRATPGISKGDLTFTTIKDPDGLFRELQIELEGIVLPRVEELKAFASRNGVSSIERKIYLSSHGEMLKQVQNLSQRIRNSRQQLAQELKRREFDQLLEEVERLQTEFAKAVHNALKSADTAGLAWGIADAEAVALMLDGRFEFYDVEVRTLLSRIEKIAKSMRELPRHREASSKWNGVRSWKDGVKEELLERAKRRRAFIATSTSNNPVIIPSPMKRKNNIPLPRVAMRKPSNLSTTSLNSSTHADDDGNPNSADSNNSLPTSITMLDSPVRIYVPSRKLYQPNPQDQLDVEIARIVNGCPLSIKVVKAIIGSATKANSSRPLSAPKYMKDRGFKSGAKYTFGEALPKSCYCRLLPNNSVVVRVGGGWQELSKFLLEHSTLEHRIPTVRSFVDYDPCYDPADPAGLRPTPLPGRRGSISSLSEDDRSDSSFDGSRRRISSGSFIPVPKRTLRPAAAIIKVDRDEVTGGAVNPYALTPRVAMLMANEQGGLRKSSIPSLKKETK
ncbi:hypothetical protein HK096_006178 [Nowakowskiella sp. JEL0078]|nr:hypothetical protein HK096_006178 [Nowakowskiella sp. JEL0078]